MIFTSLEETWGGNLGYSPNCAAVFLPDKNIMMPNDGTAEEGLRLLINKRMF